MEGRTLFAANRALPWPAEPAAALWQACTLLREHRGDGHVAALAAAGIGGREANVLQTAAGIVPREVFEAARHYDGAEWDRVSARLIDRELVGPDGKLTARGKDMRNDIEDRTDRAALTAYDRLDDEQLRQLLDALAPLARAVIATGDIPQVTPIGQRFEPWAAASGPVSPHRSHLAPQSSTCPLLPLSERSLGKHRLITGPAWQGNGHHAVFGRAIVLNYRPRGAGPERLPVLTAAGSASSLARIPRARLTSSSGRPSNSRSTTSYIQ